MSSGTTRIVSFKAGRKFVYRRRWASFREWADDGFVGKLYRLDRPSIIDLPP